MPDYDNTNRGVLFRNDGKEKETHPDYKGRITLPDGAEHWLSAWLNESKKGTKYLSLQIGDLTDEPRESAAPPSKTADFDDDIPF